MSILPGSPAAHTVTRAVLAAQATAGLGQTRLLAGLLLLAAAAFALYWLGYRAGQQAGRVTGYWDGWEAHIRAALTRRIG